MKKIFTIVALTAMSVSVAQAQRISSFTLEGIAALGPSAAINPTKNDKGERTDGELEIVFPNTVDFSNVTPVFNCGADASVTTSPIPTDFTITQKVRVDKNDGSDFADYQITCKKINPTPLPFELEVGKGFIDSWDEETLGWAGARLDKGADFPRFGGANANLILAFEDTPEKMFFSINIANKTGLPAGGIFDIEESVDGIEWSTLIRFDSSDNPMANTDSPQEEKDKEVDLQKKTRYVRFLYTNRAGGNVVLTNLSVTKGEDEPEEPGEPGGPNSIAEESTAPSVTFVVNPSNELSLIGIEKVAELSLTNVAGQVAFVQANPEAVTNLNTLSAGVYIVKITANDGSVKTGKIVVR